MKQEPIIQKNYLPGLVLSALGIFVLGIAVSAILLSLDMYRPLDTHYSAILSIITQIRSTLILKTVTVSGIFSLLVITALMALVIFYTHRIAGPLFRIKTSAKSIGEGLLSTRVKFRDRDVIHPFAESLNEMTGSYRERVRALQSEIREMKRTAEDLKTRTEQGGDREAETERVLNINRRIKQLLDDITI